MAQVMEVAVPDIGDFSDVPVIELLVGEGDTVAEEDPLVVLESDKATMEVPSPAAGTIKEMVVSVGDKVSEGTVLLKLEASNGATPSKDEPAEAAAVETATKAEESAAPETDGRPAPEPSGDGEPVYASPSVRRAAREQGIDLSTVQGSGRKGRITKDDLAGAGAGAPAAAPPVAAAPGAGERVPFTRIQELSAENLSEAWRTIPHVTHHDEADITDLEAFRKQLNAEQSDVKVTMVALLIVASVATLRAFPRFNASLDGTDVVQHAQINMGFAADTPQGLLVPVIHDADRKGLLQVATELTELSGKARARRLGPKEMSGATFTISSLGGIGGTGFSPIVNPPQVAILGAVRSTMKPVWNGQEFVPRLMLPLSLSYDHRVIDGAAAARFCRHLCTVLEDLRRVLL